MYYRAVGANPIALFITFACFWLASSISVVLYGYIIIRTLLASKPDQALIRNPKAAIWLLWYPVVYIIEVLPFSVLSFDMASNVGLVYYLGVLAIFAATGAINVLGWNITGRRFGFERPKVVNDGGKANVLETVHLMESGEGTRDRAS